MTDKLLGLDVSAYQTYRVGNIVTKHIDWDKLALQPVRFVVLRCGISWGYVDVAYSFGKAECKRLGIPMGAYHVFYPNSDPLRQAQHFVNVAGLDTDFPLVADIELGEGAHACSPLQYQKALKIYLDEIERLTGEKPIIYSRATFLDYYVVGSGVAPSWFGEYDYWLAQYLLSGVEHQGPPTLPKGVTRDKVVIHQTSDRGDGSYYGVQSKAVDLNRWQLSEAELLTFIGQEVEPEPEPEPPTFEQVVIYKLNQIMKAVGAK